MLARVGLSKVNFAKWDIYLPTHSSFRLEKQNQHSFQFFRTFSAWSNIKPLYRVTDILENPITLPENAQFSILNENNILNSFNEVALHYKAIGKNRRNPSADYRNLSDLVVFNAMRTAKQFVSVVSATELQIGDDKHFLDVCAELDAKVFPIIKDKQAALTETLKKTEVSIIERIKHCKNKGVVDDALMQEYFNIYKAIRYKKDSKFAPLEANEIAIQILINDAKREIIKSEVYETVVDVISAEVKKQQVTPLTEVTNADRQQIMLLKQNFADQRLTQFIAGGPASGKSSLTKDFLHQIKQKYGLFLRDFAYFSTDRFRLRLLKDPSLGTNPILGALLCQEEARFMTGLSFRFIKAKIQEKNVGPHLLVETVSPLHDEIEVGLMCGSQVSISTTFCSEPSKAVEENYKRFKTTGERLPPVCSVLGGQQLTTEQTLRVAKAYVGKEIINTIHDTDQMRKTDGGNGLIAAFSCRDNKMIVRNLPGLLEFVKKIHINPLADSPDKIYPSPKRVALDVLIKECFEFFGDKEVTFIDSAEKNADFNNAHQHAYAVYNKAKGFTILNEEIFARVTAQSTEVQKVVAYLKQQITKEDEKSQMATSFRR